MWRCDGVIQMSSIGLSMDDRNWFWMGKELPKSEIVYFTQVILLYGIIITSIVNLSLRTGLDELWTTLLCSSIGYLLPSPDIRKSKQNEPLLSNTP